MRSPVTFWRSKFFCALFQPRPRKVSRCLSLMLSLRALLANGMEPSCISLFFSCPLCPLPTFLRLSRPDVDVTWHFFHRQVDPLPVPRLTSFPPRTSGLLFYVASATTLLLPPARLVSPTSTSYALAASFTFGGQVLFSGPSPERLQRVLSRRTPLSMSVFN